LAIPDYEDTEREFREETNKKSRESLKKQFIDTKNIGFILVDFIPYANKNEMIDGLYKLFFTEGQNQSLEEPCLNQIPDIKESGILSGGGTTPIGTIYNSDVPGALFFRAVQKRLPEEICTLDICVGQFIDYSYYVVYSCFLKTEYQTKDIEKSFVESGDFVPYVERTFSGKEKTGDKRKGPDLEPKIGEYERHMEKFLRPFSFGLFLNSTNGESVCCPSIKVLGVPKIDYNSFEPWEKLHRGLLMFFGFEFIYCKHDQMLISYYQKSLFIDKSHSIHQGMIFLASLNDFNGKGYSEPEYEVFHKVKWSTIHSIAILFHMVYWPTYNIEIKQKTWMKKIDELTSLVGKLDKQQGLKLNEVYDKVLGSYGAFSQYFLEELENIRLASRGNEFNFKALYYQNREIGRISI
jgi:hypothetical protein